MQWAEASCTMSAQQYLRGGREMSSPASDVGYLALSQSVSSLHWLYIPTEPIGVAMRQIASALQASALTCIQYHSHKGRVQTRVVSDQGLRPMQQPSKWNQAPGPHYFQSLPVGKKAFFPAVIFSCTRTVPPTAVHRPWTALLQSPSKVILPSAILMIQLSRPFPTCKVKVERSNRSLAAFGFNLADLPRFVRTTEHCNLMGAPVTRVQMVNPNPSETRRGV